MNDLLGTLKVGNTERGRRTTACRVEARNAGLQHTGSTIVCMQAGANGAGDRDVERGPEPPPTEGSDKHMDEFFREVAVIKVGLKEPPGQWSRVSIGTALTFWL